MLAVYGASSGALGGCLVEDDDFTTADGGCKDLNTGLVWSPDLRAFGGSQEGMAQNNNQDMCNLYLNEVPANGGGFTDWRPVTVGEVQEALANGLNSHLDFFLNGSPDDFKYRWTACTKKIKGIPYRYMIRFGDGDVVLLITLVGRPDTHLICVRGQPADPANDCPSGHGKKNRASATSALSQTATGALLQLPLGVVLAVRGLRTRRP
jgi:hypothetical protein